MTKKSNFKKNLLASASIIGIGVLAQNANAVTDIPANAAYVGVTDNASFHLTGNVTMTSGTMLSDLSAVAYVLAIDDASTFTVTNATLTRPDNANAGVGILVTGNTNITNNGGTIQSLDVSNGIITIDINSSMAGVTNTGSTAVISNAGGNAAAAAIDVAAAVVVGKIVNSGSITATAGSAILTSGAGATFTSGILNSGTMSATTGIAVNLGNTTTFTTGGITNSGSIGASGAGSALTVSGIVTQSAAGTASSTATSSSFGTIYNTGTMSSVASATGAVVIGALVNNSVTFVPATGLGAGLYNAGTISDTTGSAVRLSAAGATNVYNAGVISNTTSAVNATSAALSIAAAESGTIVNAGTISTTTGRAVYQAATTTAALTNSKLITATGAAGHAIEFAAGAGSIITALTNTGTINSTTDTGIAIDFLGAAGATALTNTGTISSANTGATTGTINLVTGVVAATIANNAGGLITNTAAGGRAIMLVDTTSTLGAITNAGTISASASTGVAIDAATSTAANALTLTNTGLITGDVRMGATSSTFNMNAVNTAATSTTVGLNGNIVTAAATTGDAINFNQGAGNTQYYGGTITGAAGLGAVTAVTGTTNLTSSTVSTSTSTGGLAINTLTVNSGATLNLVSANAGGSVAANAQARVSGVTSVAAGGTLKVGPYNTLTGAAAFTNAGTLTIGVVGSTAGTYGRVAGTAVTPGTVTIDASAMGFVPTATTLSSVLSGTSLVGFTPATLTDNSFVYSFTSVLNGTNVDVLVTRENSLASAGTTPNASSTGAALETIGLTGNDSLDTIVNSLNTSSTASQANSSLATLAPTTQTSGATSQAVIALQDAAIGTVESRMETARNETSGTGVATGSGSYRNGVWGEVFGTTMSQDTRDGVSGFDADIGGVSIGADTLVSDQTRVGAALAYGHTNADGDNNEVDVDSYQGSLYATHDMDRIYIEGIAAFTYNDYSSNRTLFGGNGVASADFQGEQYSAKATAGYKFNVPGGVRITPFISAQYTFLTQDDYSETGSNAPLHVDTKDINIFKTGLGAKLAYPIVSGGITYIPRLSGTWYYDFIDDGVETTSNFIGAAGTTFISNGADLARNSFRLGAGLDVIAQDNLTVSFDYNWDTKEDFDSHTGQLKARLNF
jgi:outer membrane autotransporter protein